MTELKMVSNLVRAYVLEPEGRFLEVAYSFMREATPKEAEIMAQMIELAQEKVQARENELDIKNLENEVG